MILAAAQLITICLRLVAPGPAKAEWPTQDALSFHLSQNEESDLNFSTRYFPEDSVKYDDLDTISSFEELPGYWLTDFPWLGLALESSVLQALEENEESMESSTDADTEPTLYPASFCSATETGGLSFCGHRPNTYFQ